MLFASTQDDPDAAAEQKEEYELRASGKERRYSWDYDEHFEIYQFDEQSKKYNMLEVAYDPHNATDLVQKLQDEDDITMVEFRQGYLSMSPAAKAFEMAILGGRLRHGANPILRWMASHTVVREDPAGNILELGWVDFER